ncbi:phosphoglycerate mutase [Mycoplasmopsis columbinasalis]|uniref:2,3-bisphosphoglycerate-independent phosphoglycerate mutase n=1 Tax=Mycoplasmopsis columbinasalis TaxID=114880 RepID=A0A449BB55_9BACT|nr:2,3-bisphosphoglycerate-independent phosphoglycerate mutase [Mycoplasmopsis columbinasalis]VEU78415.1 phosphoglycerate mutase [Mycoplasmopsis columbinasalis]
MPKTVLIVIDGLGVRSETEGNAFALANTPTFDDLITNYPNLQTILASGTAVGLPAGQMGNSEVGHLTIGAGRIVKTGLTLVDDYFNKNKLFAEGKVSQALGEIKAKNKRLHLVGLFSDGGVHAHMDHLTALLQQLHTNGFSKVSLHLIGDGRDTAPRKITEWLPTLIQQCANYGYEITTIGGRFYGMDRDQMFDRVEIHYNAMLGKGEHTFTNALEYVQSQYEQGLGDEFLAPAMQQNGHFVEDGDSVFFFNFRPDRARQLTHFFIQSQLYKQQPQHKVKIDKFFSMMKYEGLDTIVAVEEDKVDFPLGKIIADAGLKQLRLAETQKYAHVTYFMDGGVELTLPNTDRVMIPSLKVKSYAEAPQMSAKEITDYLLAHGLEYDAVIMNYANPDMVGHTGDLEATIKAIEFLDTQIKRVLEWANQNDVVLLITADHGNAEVMLDQKGQPATKHTTSPVMLLTNNKSLIFSRFNRQTESGYFDLTDIKSLMLAMLEIYSPEKSDYPKVISYSSGMRKIYDVYTNRLIEHDAFNFYLMAYVDNPDLYPKVHKTSALLSRLVAFCADSLAWQDANYANATYQMNATTFRDRVGELYFDSGFSHILNYFFFVYITPEYHPDPGQLIKKFKTHLANLYNQMYLVTTNKDLSAETLAQQQKDLCRVFYEEILASEEFAIFFECFLLKKDWDWLKNRSFASENTK